VEAIKASIDKAQAVLSGNGAEKLSPTNRANLNNQILVAQQIVNKSNVTKEEYQTVLNNLETVRQSAEHEISRAMLAQLITECKGIDTTIFIEGVEAFNTSFAQALAIYNDPTSDKAEMDYIYTVLVSARAGLKVNDALNNVDKRGLESMILTAQSVVANADKYRNDPSWDEMLTALENAKAILANPNATQAEIVQATEVLRLVLNRILANAEQVQKPGQQNEMYVQNRDQENVNFVRTGDDENIAGLLAATTLAGTAAIIALKNAKRGRIIFFR